ncbi:MAG: hypothetical protein ACK4TA_01220 [Saprospiraceae bacterium]
MNVELYKRAWQINILRRCWLVLACVPVAFYPCEAQHTIPTASNACEPIIQVTHATISCFDLKNSNKVQIPTIDTPCGGAITSLTYQDSYYELAARRMPGFAGYFDWARWEKKSGDGGVDVTGAPNGILVEGANIAKVSVAPQMETILRIVIPAEGYAAFDWTNIGGSNLSLEALINTKVYTVRSKGFYRTPLLRIGDTLTLRIKATDASAIQLSNFNFFTNAIGVTERRWTATNKLGAQFIFDQFITVQRPPISNIVFPGNAAQVDAMAAPNITGFPVLDEDGDFKTLNDQRVLDKNDCGFNISWEDTTNGTVITRRWMIEDAYNGNVLEHTQQIQTTEFIPEANIKQTVPTARPNNSNADNKSDFVANFANELTDSL